METALGRETATIGFQYTQIALETRTGREQRDEIVRSWGYLPVEDEECLEPLLDHLLCVKADGIPGDIVGTQVILDVQQIVIGLAHPIAVVRLWGAHTELSLHAQ